MRTDDTNKKYRRWPPRVKRRRSHPHPEAQAPRTFPPEPPELSHRRDEAELHRNRQGSGRQVQVTVRPRRRAVLKPGDH